MEWARSEDGSKGRYKQYSRVPPLKQWEMHELGDCRRAARHGRGPCWPRRGVDNSGR